MDEQGSAGIPEEAGGDERYGAQSDPAAAPTSGDVIQTDLRPNSLGLVGATMQAITHIAPAIAALVFPQFIVSLAGFTSPLAYVFPIVLFLLLDNPLSPFSTPP